jgi:homogentisate 1,2-dioxygenase
MSRTHHITPKIPHGPAPGAIIGHTGTEVACGRFPTVNVTEEAMGLDDGQYYKSWVE